MAFFTHEQLSTARALLEKLNLSERVALLPHYSPDADALSSVFALAALCKARGIETEIISPGGTASPLPYQHPSLLSYHSAQPDLIIICDTAAQRRVYLPPAFESIPTAVIDHHVTHDITGDYFLQVSHASSTCEVLTELFAFWEVPLTSEIATMLLYGLLADTQTFRTSNTTAATLGCAQKLITAGAPLQDLVQAQIVHTTPAIITLWGELLARASFSLSNQSTWTIATHALLAENNCTPDSLAGFINTYSSLTTIDVCILFTYDTEGRSKVSLRSKQTNVHALAARFGGGGHINAAGITSTRPLMELVREITALLP